MHIFKTVLMLFVLVVICIPPTFADNPYPPPPPADVNPTESCYPPGPHEQLVNSDPQHCAYACEPGYGYDTIDTSKCVPKSSATNSPPSPPPSCPDRPKEHLKAIPDTYPCQWQCEDGYGMDGGTCTPCGQFCSKNPHSIPDLPECVGGTCKCICDSMNGFRFNEQGACVCEDGYGVDAGACAKCTDICAKHNKIPSSSSVGGVCDCTCDTAKGYHLDEKTGECVSDIDAKLIDALNANNDPVEQLGAFVPYLQSDNQRARILAAVGMAWVWRTTKIMTDPKDPKYAIALGYDRQCGHYVSEHPDEYAVVKAILNSPEFPKGGMK